MPQRRTGLVAVLVAVLIGLVGAPAGAAPLPPPNPSDAEISGAEAAKQSAAAEVGRIAGLVAEAEARLEQGQVEAEAAGTAYLIAEEALQIAQAQADQAALALQQAADAVAAARQQIAEFSRESYINGGSITRAAALLDAQGPTQLLEQAAMLDYIGANQVDVLEVLEVARVKQANADSAARAARDARAEAEAVAAAAKVEADAQLARQQAVYAEVNAQTAVYEEQLQQAEVALLTLMGARDAYQTWLAQKQAEERAAAKAAADDRARTAGDAARARGRAPVAGASDYVTPTSGRVSSCFGSRWGTTHFGVDIAAPIGTPIYAATSGVVARAGAATGFGQAVYVRGDDGAVTVYGHVNRYFVRVGERVSAGEEIAEVGNQGQSTGPHLHFEVHPDGQMYGGQTDPVPWLNDRGVAVGGCGG